MSVTGSTIELETAAPGFAQARKLAELRRMQLLASSLLIAMLVLLIASSVLEPAYPGLRWLKAFAEAGAVGGLADLFAVVALFRHPLGLPIPHTAIIPANKDRIAENLGQFVVQQFLTRENIRERLQGNNTAQAIAQWLDEPETQRMVSQFVIDIMPAVLRSIEERDAEHFLRANIAAQLNKLDPSKLAGDVLAAIAMHDKHQKFFDQLLKALEDWLLANQGLVKAKFSQASLYTPGFFDKYVADKVIAGTLALLREVTENPQHELRKQFDQMTVELIERLETSGEYRQCGHEIMSDTLEYLENNNVFITAWSMVRDYILTIFEKERAAMQEGVEGGIVALNEGLLKKPVLQSKLNPWLLEALESWVTRHRNELSALITAVVKSWDPAEVSRKIELEIGRDLQFIRINGTLVGGCAGLALHALTTALPH